MSANTQALDYGHQPPGKSRKGYWRNLGGKFLILSIVVHLLFFTGAAYYVIQIFTPKKLTFKAGVPSTNPAKQLAEHKVSMAKKRKSMSAPAPAKRVATTGLAKIILPAMPEMPANVVIPTQMVGIGGVGMGFGSGNGGNGNGDGGGGGFMAPFGSPTSQPGVLVGTLYDLKQTKNRELTKIWPGKCDEVVVQYAKSGFDGALLSHYFKGEHPLYTTQFLIPQVGSADGPKAFGLEGIVKPDMWIVHYTGKVSPPATGTFHFVGEADDYMYVKFDGKVVLDSCWTGIPSFHTPTGVYTYHSREHPFPFKRGDAIQVEAGRSYDMEVVIGDHGGQVNFCLLFEQEGVDYKKDESGNPILPLFRLENSTLPPESLPIMADGPIWKGVKSTSLLDTLESGGND